MRTETNRPSIALLVVLATMLGLARQTFGFSSSLSPYRFATRTTALSLTRDEYLQPHFEVRKKPTGSSHEIDITRMTQCAESTTGECSIDEMEKMMEGKSCFSLAVTKFGEREKYSHVLFPMLRQSSNLSLILMRDPTTKK